MQFTHPFPLNLYTSIREYTAEYMKQYIKDDIYAVRLDLPKDLIYDLEKELHSYNLPGISNLLVFKRKNYFKPRLETVHVDFSTEFIHASIVLPIEGCNDTKMFWMDGDYECKKYFLPHGDAYQLVKWKNNPLIIAEQEIIEPTLCRVDMPHDALSSIDGSYRTVLTIRLKNNPTFEEIINKRFY